MQISKISFYMSAKLSIPSTFWSCWVDLNNKCGLVKTGQAGILWLHSNSAKPTWLFCHPKLKLYSIIMDTILQILSTMVNRFCCHRLWFVLTRDTYNAAGVSRPQDQNVTNVVTVSSFWNLVTTFGILMKNAFKRVKTCLVGIGSLIREIDVKFQKFEKQTYFFCSSVEPMPAF